MSQDVLGNATSLWNEVRGLVGDLMDRLFGPESATWIAMTRRFLRKEPCWTRSNRYLRRIATGVLGPTTGEKIFAEESEFFSGGVDSDFARCLKGVKSAPTKEAPFEVFEQVEDGMFMQILEGSGQPLDQLFFTEDQAVTFVKEHRDLLHPKGYATFIPFFKKFDEGTESVRVEVFVADVRRLVVGQPKAYVDQLSDDYVWDAEDRYRFAIPQLPSAT